MKTLTGFVICASVALPLAAHAQMSDAAYCAKLSDTYRTVIGTSANSAGNVPEAMAGCATNPAGSIPTLEKALTDQKVTLPSRN
jgi:hypothetical protein